MFRAHRPLRSLQVEVTTRCSLACGFCPRQSLRGWIDRDLSDAAWARIARDLPLTDDVHLQGWGEPLLDERLRDRVRDAHRAGCSVGLTTNGADLAAHVDWLAAERVERIAVSVAATAELHARQRAGAPLERIWQAIRALAAARRGRTPRLLVSIMLTRDGADGLAAIVDDAASAGADEVYVTHVDCTPTPELLERAAFSGGRLRPGLSASLDDAAAAARRAGIGFRPPAVEASEVLVCALDPRRFACVAADGRVGPCINMLLPVPGPLERHHEAGTARVQPIVWGCLPDDALGAALDRRAAFVAPFDARLEAERQFNDAVGDAWGCPALEILEQADRVRSQALARATFPAACDGCHKAMGW